MNPLSENEPPSPGEVDAAIQSAIRKILHSSFASRSARQTTEELDAEDLWGEARSRFYRWLHHKGSSEKCNYLAYARAIAANVCYDFFRRKGLTRSQTKLHYRYLLSGRLSVPFRLWEIRREAICGSIGQVGQSSRIDHPDYRLMVTNPIEFYQRFLSGPGIASPGDLDPLMLLEATIRALDGPAELNDIVDLAMSLWNVSEPSTISLQTILAEGDDATLEGLIPDKGLLPDQVIQLRDYLSRILSLLPSLPLRERRALLLYPNEKIIDQLDDLKLADSAKLSEILEISPEELKATASLSDDLELAEWLEMKTGEPVSRQNIIKWRHQARKRLQE